MVIIRLYTKHHSSSKKNRYFARHFILTNVNSADFSLSLSRLRGGDSHVWQQNGPKFLKKCVIIQNACNGRNND